MSRALLIINNDMDRKMIARLAHSVPDGTRVEFKKGNRSTAQNTLLWGRLTDIARQVNWYGEYLTPADWKDVFTAALRKAKVVPGIDPGSFVAIGLRTSDMTKHEMSNLLDLIDAFGAERGVKFSDHANAP